MRKIFFKKFMAYVLIFLVALPVAGCNNTPSEAPALTLDKTSASIELYDTLLLSATLVGSGEAITWSSSDVGKATVSGGFITALGAGSVTITASAGSLKASCTVSITDAGNAPVIWVGNAAATIEKGDSFPLTVEARYKGNKINGSFEFSWSGEDTGIISLNSIGSNSSYAIATGLKTGSTVITVSATIYGVYCTQDIAVNVINGDISFDLPDVAKINNVYTVDSLYTIPDGGNITTYDLGSKLSVKDNGVETEFPIIWRSSNENIVTVNENGIISSHKAGSATVTAECEGNTLGVNITVRRPQIMLADAEPYVISLFDKAAYQADNTVFRFKTGETIGYINEGYDEVLEQVKIDDFAVYNGTLNISKNEITNIQINYGGYLVNNRKNELGQKSITFETDLATWVYPIKVYTQVLETVSDLQNWLNVSAGLRGLSNNKPNGYFVLGNNITSADYWTYTPQVMGGGTAAGYNSWDSLFTNNTRNFLGFEGIFDGNGYYIQKMNIQTFAGDGEDYTAFIPTIATAGELKNVAFLNCRYTIKSDVDNRGGFISACNAGKISDVYIDVTVTRDTQNAGKLIHWGPLTAFAGGAAVTQRCVIKSEITNTAIFAWGAAASSASVFYASTAMTFSNIFAVSGTFTKLVHQESGYAPANSAFFASATAMKNAAGTYNYSANFTSPVWITDANGLPYFASMGVSPYSYN